MSEQFKSDNEKNDDKIYFIFWLYSQKQISHMFTDRIRYLFQK